MGDYQLGKKGTWEIISVVASDAENILQLNIFAVSWLLLKPHFLSKKHGIDFWFWKGDGLKMLVWNEQSPDILIIDQLINRLNGSYHTITKIYFLNMSE